MTAVVFASLSNPPGGSTWMTWAPQVSKHMPSQQPTFICYIDDSVIRQKGHVNRCVIIG